MNESEFEKWMRLHQSRNLAELPDHLRDSWLYCRQIGLDASAASLPRIDDKQFEYAKQDSFKLFVFANKVLANKVRELEHTNIGLALFNADGILLRLYGSKGFFQWAQSQSITVQTYWSEEDIGTNAVSLGLKHRMGFHVYGAMHYAKAFLDVDVAFSPCLLERELSQQLLGGVALLQAENPLNTYFDPTVLTNSLVKEIGLRLYFSDSSELLNISLEQGILSLDFSNNRRRIIYLNHFLCELFHLESSAVYFKEVEEVFDPLPANKLFWSVLSSHKNVENVILPISINGCEQKFILSSMHYSANNLGFVGIKIFISPVNEIHGASSSSKPRSIPITFNSLIGKDDAYLSAVSTAKMVSRTDSTILLLGESGVGKDMFAQAIHNTSHRKDGPFVAINCAAIPKELISSELFGYSDGAFTGSKRGGHKGKIEEADGGTLFLDEIGDMPLSLQTVFLRFLEQKTIERLGSNRQVSIDVRIIAATNANLIEKVAQKEFREDLYYRLNVITLRLPSLRERPDDIERLAFYFLDIYAFQQNCGPMTFSPAAISLLRSLPWKGNIRELKNLIEGLVMLYPASEIQVEQVVERMNIKQNLSDHYESKIQSQPPISTVDRWILTREQLEKSLAEAKYNKSLAAQNLGISRKTLYKWIKRYGL